MHRYKLHRTRETSRKSTSRDTTYIMNDRHKNGRGGEEIPLYLKGLVYLSLAQPSEQRKHVY
jgi:hypothetical protein